MSWNSLIIVAYSPHFSEEFKDFIRNTCTPTMQGTEDDEGQYMIDYVDDAAMMADSQATEQDIAIISLARHNKVEYFEF